jgi:hypothetical protein
VESAKAHKNMAVVIPDEKEYVYDPDTGTDCGPMCLDFLKIGHTFTGGVSERILEEQLATRKVAGVHLKVDNGHATLVMKNSDVCEHLVSNKCHEVTPSEGVVQCSEHFDRRYLQGGETNTFLKASVVACDMKSNIWNVAAMPFHDANFWQDKREVNHWAVTKDYGRRLLPPLPKRHKVHFNRNLLCEECVAVIPSCANVYADVGTDLPVEQLAAFQLRILENLARFSRVAVKLQNFKEVLRRWPKQLLAELEDRWKIYEHEYFQANEVFAVRGYKPTKLQKLCLNKFTYISKEGCGLALDKGEIKDGVLKGAEQKVRADSVESGKGSSVDSDSESSVSLEMTRSDVQSPVYAESDMDSLFAELDDVFIEEVDSLYEHATTSIHEGTVELTTAVERTPTVYFKPQQFAVDDDTRTFNDKLKDKKNH